MESGFSDFTKKNFKKREKTNKKMFNRKKTRVKNTKKVFLSIQRGKKSVGEYYKISVEKMKKYYKYIANNLFSFASIDYNKIRVETFLYIIGI